jgi:hypothetical protein
MCARHGHRLGGESPLVSWLQRVKRGAERRTARTVGELPAQLKANWLSIRQDPPPRGAIRPLPRGGGVAGRAKRKGDAARRVCRKRDAKRRADAAEPDKRPTPPGPRAADRQVQSHRGLFGSFGGCAVAGGRACRGRSARARPASKIPAQAACKAPDHGAGLGRGQKEEAAPAPDRTAGSGKAATSP